MEIIWTVDAESDLVGNVNYLINEWSEKSARNLIAEIDSVIELIQTNYDLFPICEIPLVRKAVVRRHISLYYKIDGAKFYVLRIWNNYKNPGSLRV
ncbi:MAG: type II toxin-antitoxin system RelE/ParE family toxin [Algoriphagus sp.]|uniref:type II toxin-antitoxin system RelE/ParE family toxin n=1 Tax=Algoriphagus sp. TaxID=1872435 RepID=UPI00327A6187